MRFLGDLNDLPQLREALNRRRGNLEGRTESGVTFPVVRQWNKPL